MNHAAKKRSIVRYGKRRFLLFLRSWTDTRTDRVPSWSKLYLRVYFYFLGLAMAVAAVPLTALSLALGSTAVWRAYASLPGGIALLALLVCGLPAIAAYRWIRPIWLDLVMVRERAIDFTGGRFNTRARESQSVIIGTLARTLNALAERMERLIAAQRELTNGISHELRTPLARARFALEILREPASAEEAQSAVESIAQDMTELDELIDMSLTYARLEYMSLQSHPEPAALLSWFNSQVQDATLLYVDKEITLDIQVDPNARVAMDKRLMSYAVRNLLRNAGRYARSHMLVGLSIRHGNVEIFVEDDGVGVPLGERERIFESFVRLDRATTGYGLGLAIARQVLRAHNGRIVATDAPTLKGARFEVSWPAGVV